MTVTMLTSERNAKHPDDAIKHVMTSRIRIPSTARTIHIKEGHTTKQSTSGQDKKLRRSSNPRLPELQNEAE